MSDTTNGVLTAPIVVTITAHTLSELYATLDRSIPVPGTPAEWGTAQELRALDPAQLIAGIAWGASPAEWREGIANPGAWFGNFVQAVHEVTHGDDVQPGPALWEAITDRACVLYGGPSSPTWTGEHKATTWAVLGLVLPVLLGGSQS